MGKVISNIILERININGFDLLIEEILFENYPTDKMFYTLQVVHYENYLGLLHDIISFKDMEYTRNNDSENNKCSFYLFDSIDDIYFIIEVANQLLPKGTLLLGSTFLLYDSLCNVKKDNFGNYYILFENEESNFISDLGFDIKKLIYDTLGYYIQSKYMVFKNMIDLNKFVSFIQYLIEQRAKRKKNWLKVDDCVLIGKNTFYVKFDKTYYLHPESLIGYWLTTDQEKKYDQIISDTLEMNCTSFSTRFLDKTHYSWFSIFSCERIEQLTKIVDLMLDRIDFLISSNEKSLYQKWGCYGFGGYGLGCSFKIGSKICQFSARDSEILLGLMDSNEIAINNDLIEDIFLKMNTSSEDFCKEILGYYKKVEGQIAINSFDESKYFVKVLLDRFNKFNEREINFNRNNYERIFKIDEKICLNSSEVEVKQNSNGYYLLSVTDNTKSIDSWGGVYSRHRIIEQVEFIDNLNKSLNMDIDDFAELCLGYNDGGIFPYCRSSLHLTALVDAIRVKMGELSKPN
jgi:hypothetical protein